VIILCFFQSFFFGTNFKGNVFRRFCFAFAVSYIIDKVLNYYIEACNDAWWRQLQLAGLISTWAKAKFWSDRCSSSIVVQELAFDLQFTKPISADIHWRKENLLNGWFDCSRRSWRQRGRQCP